MADADHSFDFVFLTDPHIDGGVRPIERLGAVLDEINALDPLPAFAVCGGDITLQGGAGEKYAELMATLRMPVYHVIGNHEVMVGEDDPWAAFRAMFAPTHYSWDHGPAHFVALNGTCVNRAFTDWRNVEGYVSDEELAWLDADLRAFRQRSAAGPIVCFIHIPIRSTFTERNGFEPHSMPAWEITNADQVVEVLAAHEVDLVLQGHMHENERIVEGGIVFRTVGAISGQWWSRTGDELCVDGSPKGYCLVPVSDTSVSARYCPVEYDGNPDLRIESLPGEDADRPQDVVVNVFVGGEDTPVRARLDGGPWIELAWSPTVRRDWQPTVEAHEVRGCAHVWRGAVSDAPLGPGEHLVEASADLPDGRRVTETRRTGE